MVKTDFEGVDDAIDHIEAQILVVRAIMSAEEEKGGEVEEPAFSALKAYLEDIKIACERGLKSLGE